MDKFCRLLMSFVRIRTRKVRIGSVVIGGGEPVAVQSMANVDTMDTQACVAQIGRIHATGCDIVRLTTQGKREAANLEAIVAGVREAKQGQDVGLRDVARQEQAVGLNQVALVADIHFTPDAALVAAQFADKVRINPGNYDISRLPELLGVCRERGIPIRIGVNHGSLSARMVEQYGDTPRGMVESAMEFLRECRRNNFYDVVVSMKSSNVRVMVHAYRLLAATMVVEGMDFPLHLGVTEAGDGADGRIRSAVGIGALMADGLGDTIRVSLTEPPENEIPVAQAITAYFACRQHAAVAQTVESIAALRAEIGDVAALSAETEIAPKKAEAAGIPTNLAIPIASVKDEDFYSPYEYSRRKTIAEGNIGGTNVPILYKELDPTAHLALADGRIAVIESLTDNAPAEWRSIILNMMAQGDRCPVILHKRYNEQSLGSLQIKAACDFGMVFIDGLADGIWIENEAAAISDDDTDEIALSILQAARVRMTKTEYIACPGCGRTLFDLQSTLAAVRAQTSHLTHLKIAVMGCIVNGPGEMADADYGYVGAGRGVVTLYKGKEVMRRSIPQAEAVSSLVELIKSSGDWTDPV